MPSSPALAERDPIPLSPISFCSQEAGSYASRFAEPKASLFPFVKSHSSCSKEADPSALALSEFSEIPQPVAPLDRTPSIRPLEVKAGCPRRQP
ncbi:hypothetical protein MA16_Dca008101 [Dendrobium catenatum]|uniref:Uncharacterized protein n=1 Tax=Dendrobium catenatum TaxID=906689 RepID=A0A2I0WCZ6_9ASPA|nr:hypothetical protein MA16_Dca008101 [Dendrobium catenatum]